MDSLAMRRKVLCFALLFYMSSLWAVRTEFHPSAGTGGHAACLAKQPGVSDQPVAHAATSVSRTAAVCPTHGAAYHWGLQEQTSRASCQSCLDSATFWCIPSCRVDLNTQRPICQIAQATSHSATHSASDSATEARAATSSLTWALRCHGGRWASTNGPGTDTV